MISRTHQAAALLSLICCFSFTNSAISAEKSVATLTVDTYISNDGDDPLEEPSDVQGARTNITIRGGSNGANSLNAKAFLKFDLTEAINPGIPYFLEITTDDDGSSNDDFAVHSITDPALLPLINETTLSWDVAAANAPNAIDSFFDFDAAGNQVASFTAPGSINTPILVPIFGSGIQTTGAGFGSAVFGIAGDGLQFITIKSKEQAAGVGAARLFTFDTIDSNGTGGGALNTAATWSNNAVPVADNFYQVLSGDTVVADGVGSFAGSALIVNGGATLDFTDDGSDQGDIFVNAGGNLTQNSSGNFFLGDINGPNTLALDGTATFNPTTNADIFIDMNVTGAGNIVVNSNGATSSFFPSFTSAFTGTITFNGDGDEVQYTEPNSGIGDGGRLEMNSTGSNTLALNADRTGGGTVAFNQPGAIDHRSNSDRLNGVQHLEANAPVTVDLTKTFSGNERRLFIPGSLTGSADLTINGTASDPTSGTTTLNEFELGNTDENTPEILSTYSGTVTTNGFVNVELRRSLPAAAVVVNSGGFVEFGFRNINDDFSTQVGELAINAGGKLEVGHEVDGQHVPSQLHVTSSGGKSGDLTLSSTSTLTMQISGTGDNDFDSILVDGTAMLDGTLEILVNPAVPSQVDTITAGPYVPTLGDTFDIIVASSGLTADFNGVDGVDGADLALWEAAFGVDAGGDTDSDSDSDGTDFLNWQTQVGAAGASGTLIDNSIVLNVVDVDNVFAGTGLQFQLNISSTLVQLEVVAAAAVAAVPEPSSCVLVTIGLFMLSSRGSRKVGVRS